jgi:hypothetical protein
LARRVLGPNQGCASFFRPEAPHRDSRNHERVHSPPSGRELTRIQVVKPAFCFIQAPDQEQAPDL